MNDLLLLSLLSLPLQREYLNGTRTAAELVEYCRIGSLEVQPHLKGVYGNDPFIAAGRIEQACGKHGHDIVTIESSLYPEYLREIHDPPLVLYTKGGNLPERCVSVVGTRNSDAFSETITDRLCGELCAAGYAIVSGMARGIDRAAHLAALNRAAITVGVCANGIDYMYPRENSDLFARVSFGLVLVSEHPPRIRAGKWAFAKRNRIISGFSRKCIVVKASRKSGAMITARYAVDQGRDLFVCAGHAYDEDYEGCLSLINSGAIAVFDASTVLAEEAMILPQCRDLFKELPASPPVPETLAANEIYPLIKAGCTTVDELVVRSGKRPSEVLSLVMQMTLSGAAELVGDSVRLCI